MTDGLWETQCPEINNRLWKISRELDTFNVKNFYVWVQWKPWMTIIFILDEYWNVTASICEFICHFTHYFFCSSFGISESTGVNESNWDIGKRHGIAIRWYDEWQGRLFVLLCSLWGKILPSQLFGCGFCYSCMWIQMNYLCNKRLRGRRQIRYG